MPEDAPRIIADSKTSPFRYIVGGLLVISVLAIVVFGYFIYKDSSSTFLNIDNQQAELQKSQNRSIGSRAPVTPEDTEIELDKLDSFYGFAKNLNRTLGLVSHASIGIVVEGEVVEAGPVIEENRTSESYYVFVLENKSGEKFNYYLTQKEAESAVITLDPLQSDDETPSLEEIGAGDEISITGNINLLKPESEDALIIKIKR